MLRLPLLCLCAVLAQGAVSDVKIIGSTNVQSLLTYTSPDDSACTLEVSEQPSLRPLVNDVNPALFPGADSDARAGNLADGRTRVFVIGRRAVEQGADGKWYSRALQAETMHYYRIRCGSDSVGGAFRTANIPVGVTYPWPIPQDPNTGHFRWPSTDNNDRAQVLIDPNYGTQIRRVSVAGDAPGEVNLRRRAFAAAAGWTDAAAAASPDDAAAQYSGTGREWLVLTNANTTGFSAFYAGALGIDRIVVRVRGSAAGDSDPARTIDVCLTLDGANCAGAIRQVALDRDSSVKTLGDQTNPPDTWGIDGLFPNDIVRNDRFGVMLRASGADAAQIAVQYVDFDVFFSEQMSMPEGGFMEVCAQGRSNGGFHCSFKSTMNVNHLFWIQPDTGEVRWLGKIVARGWGGNGDTLCGSSFALFDPGDPNVYYCHAELGGRAVLLKGTYTGNDRAADPGSSAPFDWVNLTPPGSTIPDLIKQFSPDFDDLNYRPVLQFLTNQYAVYRAWREGQDSIGWLAVFDIPNGKIVAAAKTYAAPNSRWCGLHTVESVGNRNWIGWDATLVMFGNGYGWGPFKITLLSDLPPAQGTFTVNVSGEPEPFLMPAEAGDLFQFQQGNKTDYLRLVEKLSPTQWLVERIVRSGDAAARLSGTEAWAFCSARQLDVPGRGAYVYWDFLNDPQARDATGTRWVVERNLTGGHVTQRRDFRVMTAPDGYSVVTPGVPDSFNHARSFRVAVNPNWAGKNASRMGTSVTVGYQSHPSFANANAADPGRGNWFVDAIPFVGGLATELSAVPGFTQVYRVATNLNRDTFPTFAVCGGRQLKDVSPGPIRDQDAYSFCVGGQCAEGAGGADIFVNCPAPIAAASRCDYNSTTRSVCVGDLAPYGQSVTQFYLDGAGMRNRVLTNALYAWNTAGRTSTFFDTAYSLPDGSWVLFASYGNNGRRDLYMVKVPSQPDFDPDPTRGAAPIEQEIKVAAPSGAEQMVLNFGNGAVTQSCRGGDTCSITVPLRPLEVLAAAPVFRDGSGREMRSGVQASIAAGLQGAGLPRPKLAGSDPVRNAFSGEPKLAPGAAVSIFGDNLAECEATGGTLPLPASLCNASVMVNGERAPLYYASPTQINAQLPVSLAPGSAELFVDRGGDRTDVAKLDNVGAVAPAIAAYSDGRFTRAAMRLSDGSLNSPERPLTPGSAASLYATALGPTDPVVAEGQGAPQDPLVRTTGTVEVYVNDVSQPVSFSGLAPGLSGIYQVNFTLDASTPVNPDGQNFVWLRVNGVDGPKVAISLARP